MASRGEGAKEKATTLNTFYSGFDKIIQLREIIGMDPRGGSPLQTVLSFLKCIPTNADSLNHNFFFCLSHRPNQFKPHPLSCQTIVNLVRRPHIKTLMPPSLIVKP